VQVDGAALDLGLDDGVLELLVDDRPANGMPRIFMTMKLVSPAIVAWASAPPT
jgi:hypothetical protein